jgi:hypothetical protein
LTTQGILIDGGYGMVGVLRPLPNGEVTKPGAWMAEQVIDTAPFFTALAAKNLHVIMGPVGETL